VERSDDWGDGAPDDDLPFYGAPLPPDDRIWRHPSELAYAGGPAPVRPRRGVWPAALVSGLVGSVLTCGLLAVVGLLGGETTTVVRERELVPGVQPAAFGRGAGSADSVERIAAETRAAIPRIEVDGDEPGSGSGVLFRDDGYLLTNAHVVDGADSITVVLDDGSEWDGELIGIDTVTDVAVVRIKSDQPFPTALLGSAADLRVGQAAIAIGSPLGLEGSPSVTTGVVSALGRRVDTETGAPLYDMIQTDAAIAPGSSGGALLDDNGAVIGITTAIAVSDVGAEGLGFATPIDIARSVAEEIIATGRAVHVWLGIQGSDIGSGGGAMVEQGVTGSPAFDAGLVARDVIVSVDGEDVGSMSGLVIALRDRDPGEVVEVAYLRDDQPRRVSVTLTERP
jgi:S1-C subfamily serine protease